MLNKIIEIIKDFFESELESSLSRLLHIIPVHGKASVCIGVRRCGKSTLMSQVILKLLADGIQKANVVYLNFFDDRLHGLHIEGLGAILEAYYSIYPEKKGREKVYFFFDEIQIFSGWETFVSRLLASEKCEVYLTGSSAHMLSKEISTQMRGRAVSWELFPFSFKEYLLYKGMSIPSHFSTRERLLTQKAFDEYWNVGGFPETLALGKLLRIKIHQEYFNTILFRDILERHNASQPKALKDLALWLVDNNASLYSINSLTGYMKSLGHKTSKNSVSEMLEWFEDAYFFFTVRIFDASLARANANPKKIYCVDHAFVNSLSSGILVNSGHQLENLVFVALRRLTTKIYYYRTANGQEVDFVALIPGQPKLLIQVCALLKNPQTRKREVDALIEGMTALVGVKALIVTQNEEEKIETKAGQIEVIPAWRFLLLADRIFSS